MFLQLHLLSLLPPTYETGERYRPYRRRHVMWWLILASIIYQIKSLLGGFIIAGSHQMHSPAYQIWFGDGVVLLLLSIIINFLNVYAIIPSGSVRDCSFSNMILFFSISAYFPLLPSLVLRPWSKPEHSLLNKPFWRDGYQDQWNGGSSSSFQALRVH